MSDTSRATVTVDLDVPLTRGDTAIATLVLRKPHGGELRGISLAAIANLDVDELRKILPRICVPLITKAEAEEIDVADLLNIGGELVDFLLTKARKPAYPDR